MFRLKQLPYLREGIYLGVIALIAAILIISLQSQPTQLEQIQKRGVLKVATRNSPMTYFIDRGQPAGFEYELAKDFANYLGVRMQLIVPTTFPDLSRLLKERQVDIAASNLVATPQRKLQFRAGPAYRHSAPEVIYRVRQGNPRPKEIEDLYGKTIVVQKGSSEEELLIKLKDKYPKLEWTATTQAGVTDLLNRVHESRIDYTILDSTAFEVQQSFYPGLAEGFTLTKKQPTVWLYPRYADNSMEDALEDYFSKPETQELIKELTDRYLSHQNRLGFFDTQTFRQDLQTRYPQLEQYFMLAAQQTGQDPLLLASIAYQESHWDPGAVSPTGVKGIMMLTEGAAKEVGVSDRTDPRQSVLGGAQYLLHVKAKIPGRIKEPDHTWLALAGYNIGFGHLEDARVLAQNAGLNPDRWRNVRKFLPRLADRHYYPKTRFGYARGNEAVTYVGNIRKYLEIMRWEVRTRRMHRSRTHPETEQELSEN